SAGLLSAAGRQILRGDVGRTLGREGEAGRVIGLKSARPSDVTVLVDSARDKQIRTADVGVGLGRTIRDADGPGHVRDAGDIAAGNGRCVTDLRVVQWPGAVVGVVLGDGKLDTFRQ